MLVLGHAFDLTLEGLHDVLVPVPQQVLHNVRMRYCTQVDINKITAKLNGFLHRRRIYTEEKTNIVAASWGVRIASFSCHFSYFELGRVEETADFPPIIQLVLVQKRLFLNCPGAKQLARQGIEAILFPKKQRRPLPSLL